MKRLVAAVAVVMLLAGCSAAPIEPAPEVKQTWDVEVPDDGVTLAELGFQNAPEGVSVPRGTTITEKIDQGNNVTVVFTAPTGAELAGYLRRTLPAAGFEITEDGNNSLLFTRAPWQGAFTTSDGYSALSFRTDREDP